MKAIYLCGGINGLSDADAKEWREAASVALLRAGWQPLDPMRRDFRGKEHKNAEFIIRSDLLDIARCEAVLVNASRPSWGTAMEVFYAFRSGRRVVAFGAGDRPSPWLLYHTERLFPDLSSALAYLCAA